MSHAVFVSVLIVAAAALAGATVGVAASLVGRHRDLLVKEKAHGNERVRRVMSHQVGGRHPQPERKSRIEKAEHMRGWVFIVVSRHPGHGLQEHVGWAYTRRGAERKLARRLGAGRGERGAATGGMLMGAAIIFAALVILATMAPHPAHQVLSNNFAGWLQHLGNEFRDWLRRVLS